MSTPIHKLKNELDDLEKSKINLAKRIEHDEEALNADRVILKEIKQDIRRYEKAILILMGDQELRDEGLRKEIKNS